LNGLYFISFIGVVMTIRRCHLSLNKDWIYESEARIQKKEVELNLKLIKTSNY